MHVGDTIFIFCLALIIFGPKKLPEIGRQIGKLMVEFRRASNEFKMQIDEELRASDEAERQKEITAATTMLPTATATAPLLEGATPSEAATPATATPVIAPPSTGLPVNRSFDGAADRVARDSSGAVSGLDATAGTCAYEAVPAEAYPEPESGFNPGLNTASNGLSPEAELIELPATAKPEISAPESSHPAVQHG